MNKSVISGFINNSDLENKIKILETKAEIKSEQDKILKMVTYDLNYFPGRILFGDVVLQTCLFISQHLERFSHKKKRALIIFLAGNQKGFIVLFFLRNIITFCLA